MLKTNDFHWICIGFSLIFLEFQDLRFFGVTKSTKHEHLGPRTGHYENGKTFRRWFLKKLSEKKINLSSVGVW